MRPTFILSLLVLNAFAQTNHYYFGNLHSHTAFSDGNKDSVSSGVNTPAASFSYAKLSDNFDFLGISEHNHYSTSKNPGFKLPRYMEGLTMADAANQEGSFLALFGMEYGISSGNNGHVIIYGFNQLIGWETNVGGSTGNNYDIYNAKNDYTGLFQKVRNNVNSFGYLAHPYWTDFSTDGTTSKALAFSDYNAMFDSAIVGMPLRSGNAFSTNHTYSDYPTEHYFDYFKKMLYIGYHLGIGYDHDNHYTNFGRSNGGRLVIIAPSLSRASLYKAMKDMHFYGSDDSNAELEFTCAGNIMGTIVSGNHYPVIKVTHSDPDGETADTVRIWRGHSNSGGLWAEVISMTTGNNTSTYTDYSIVPGTEYYYFTDVKQTDGQWMVSSPVWYTGIAPLTVSDITEEGWGCHVNYVNRQVSYSFADPDEYTITVSDLTGKPLLSQQSKKNGIISLSDLPAGIYLFQANTAGRSMVKKLCLY